MRFTEAQSLFSLAENLTIDLTETGVVLDFSKCKSATMVFYRTGITHIGIVDLTGMTTGSSLSETFAYSRKLHTIDKLILRDDGSNKFAGTFSLCDSLQNILIEGVIGENFDIRYSPLTRESMMGKEITSDVYNALSETVQTNNVYVKDGKYYYGGVITALSTTATGKTVTFSKTAKQNAFTDAEWAALIATKQNWTFTLV
jgi:hypothetical protein